MIEKRRLYQLYFTAYTALQTMTVKNHFAFLIMCVSWKFFSWSCPGSRRGLHCVSELSWDDPDGWISFSCVCLLISMRPHLNSSHTTLKQHSKRARLNVYMLKILPVLHLLRSLVIKSGHMATVCIGEGEKPTQASLTQVMT